MNAIKSSITSVAILFSATLAVGALAQAPDHNAMPGMKIQGMAGMKADAATATISDGEVRKIDKDTQKITLKHGEIKNLAMPGMTMVFRIKDTALLDKVKAGDKVRFTAEKADGAIVVTHIEVAG